MPNFLSLAFFDTLALAGSLQRHMGDFKDVPTRPGLRILRVQSHAKGSGDADDLFGVHDVAKRGKWVELANLRGEIARRAEAIMPPGIEFGRIFLEMLDPGATLDWHTETAPYFARWGRAIMPLRTNPATLLVCGTETASPGPGWLTIVSPRLPCAAINMGEHAWVTLVVVFKLKVEADG
jgi:hypothetical protein